ncbi:hypothetical protein [Kineosporia sp. NBRC 101731]|uniref:hypothetical protein n=1 Tax=Kineosporia sp. NBRC 101731 TaxID=3032199 RepID=UPI0024A13E29|nr:hypothetical protein [Kineosporia sp. NBRC 101731]GLY27981.1 hypothetical protein Kisp02_13460 [Kineosporia sp. NBRC 101731]
MPDQGDDWGFRLEQLAKDDTQRKGQFYSNSTSVMGMDWGRKDWAYSTIEQIKWMADSQNSATHSQAATTWGRIVAMLEGMRSGLRAAGTSMQEGWDPSVTQAAANFFSHIGASAWSLDDWITYAKGNQAALESIASEVNEAKKNINAIYNNFEREYNNKVVEIGRASPLLGNASDDSGSVDGQKAVDALKVDLNQIIENYTKQAAVVMNALGDSYITNAYQLAEGRKYQGPTTSKTAPNSSPSNSSSKNNAPSGSGPGTGRKSDTPNPTRDNSGTGKAKDATDPEGRTPNPTNRRRPSTGDGADTPKGDPKDTGDTGDTGNKGGTGGTDDTGGTGITGDSGGTGGTGDEGGSETPTAVVGQPAPSAETATGDPADVGSGSPTGDGTGNATGTGNSVPVASRPTVIRGTPASTGTPVGSGGTPTSTTPTTRFGTPAGLTPDGGGAGRPSAFPSNPAGGVPGSPIGRGAGGSSGFPGGPGGRSGLPGGAGMRNSLLGRLGGGGGGGTSSFPSGGGGSRGVNGLSGGAGGGTRGISGGGAGSRGVPGAGGVAGRGMSGSGGGPSGRGMPGSPGQNGKGRNGISAGRKNGRRLEDGEDAKKGPSYREDSAEYLGDMPEMPQQLLGPARPKVEPGRRTGFSLGRLSKKRRVEEELEGRRSRPQVGDELIVIPAERKPDLTGRRAFGGLEIEKAAPVGLPDLLKGGHAAPEVVAPEGARRGARRGEGIEAEQWQVDVPDRIVAAQEEVAQHRGHALAAENRRPSTPSS